MGGGGGGVRGVGLAYAKVQSLERSDRVSGTERAVPPWYRDRARVLWGHRELAGGLVVLGFAGAWILHEEQIYFRPSECWLLFILPLILHHSGVSIPSSSLFPKTESGQVQGWGL